MHNRLENIESPAWAPGPVDYREITSLDEIVQSQLKLGRSVLFSPDDAILGVHVSVGCNIRLSRPSGSNDTAAGQHLPVPVDTVPMGRKFSTSWQMLGECGPDLLRDMLVHAIYSLQMMLDMTEGT